ncbi:hypothetical protein [Bacteroides sedimenti]|uniref:hypothetical protein n=1 Tax=Bacteroides sedimenti TaxID=2136147 RepID=UPI003340BB86
MKKPASFVIGIVLLLMATVQLLRFLFALDVVVNGFIVPVWFSLVAAIFLFLLAVWLLKERTRQ